MADHLIPDFHVVPGTVVHAILADLKAELIDLIEQAYVLHGEGETTNPPSYFLRFPDKPSARIIALPASVRGDVRLDGLKWVSSYPGNIESGIPRASAALLLNDPDTGYPFACLEGSIISAARTAASGAVAVRQLSKVSGRPTRVGFFGTGLIARYIYDYLDVLGLPVELLRVHDLSAVYAEKFAAYVRGRPRAPQVQVLESPEALVRSCDLVVFATNASRPHVVNPAWFGHNPLVLHISLRDLSPQIVLGSANVVDDIDHVLRAETSVHLAEQQTGRRDFIDATLFDVIKGRFRPGGDRPVIFSPFGLGVLDLVVAGLVYRRAAEAGSLTKIEGFFHDVRRHSGPLGQEWS
jgi:ornithine cyclodeaminase